jgi:hypothetical protein
VGKNRPKRPILSQSLRRSGAPLGRTALGGTFLRSLARASRRRELRSAGQRTFVRSVAGDSMQRPGARCERRRGFEAAAVARGHGRAALPGANDARAGKKGGRRSLPSAGPRERGPVGLPGTGGLATARSPTNPRTRYRERDACPAVEADGRPSRSRERARRPTSRTSAPVAAPILCAPSSGEPASQAYNPRVGSSLPAMGSAGERWALRAAHRSGRPARSPLSLGPALGKERRPPFFFRRRVFQAPCSFRRRVPSGAGPRATARATARATPAAPTSSRRDRVRATSAGRRTLGEAGEHRSVPVGTLRFSRPRYPPFRQ